MAHPRCAIDVPLLRIAGVDGQVSACHYAEDLARVASPTELPKDIVEQARDDHEVHTHAQLTPVTHVEVGLELSPAHLCVKHGRDPGSQDRVLGGLEVT